jgi:hypothetical protein
MNPASFRNMNPAGSENMSPAEIVERTRRSGVSLALDPAGTGLLLSTDGDPPADLVNLIRGIKTEIVAHLQAECGRHSLLLRRIEAARPADAADAQWDSAMRGLWTFLGSGRADEALSLGWPHDELFAVPPVWTNTALCGAALLIGDREVVEVIANRIQIKTASGAILSFYRRSQPDYGLVYRERRKVLARNLGADEAHFRALDYAINVCRQHSGVGLEQAKTRVRAALAAALDRGHK